MKIRHQHLNKFRFETSVKLVTQTVCKGQDPFEMSMKKTFPLILYSFLRMSPRGTL